MQNLAVHSFPIVKWSHHDSLGCTAIRISHFVWNCLIDHDWPRELMICLISAYSQILFFINNEVRLLIVITTSVVRENFKDQSWKKVAYYEIISQLNIWLLAPPFAWINVVFKSLQKFPFNLYLVFVIQFWFYSFYVDL